MKESTKIFVISFIIIAVLSISLIVFSTNSNSSEDIRKKINSEIAYLDNTLISMLNKVNGISMENYIIQSEKVKENENSNEEGSSSNSKESGSSEDSGANSQNDSESTSGKSSNNVNYKMVENQILLQDRASDWASLKVDIEKLYSDWETILLDLYKVNVNNDAILNFGTYLDTATSAIQNEDKAKTLNALAKLYSYIPQYSSSFSDNTKPTNLYKTKSNILNAYALIEQDDFTKINDELKNAEQNFIPILNDINSKDNSQTNINKSYILIKDLQGFGANTSKEIFYIKYKNLMQNLNNI